MIDYTSCMINQKYIFAGGMLGGREGFGTSHCDHFLLLQVFYNTLPQFLWYPCIFNIECSFLWPRLRVQHIEHIHLYKRNH